jgi:hypothetical protein
MKNWLTTLFGILGLVAKHAHNWLGFGGGCPEERLKWNAGTHIPSIVKRCFLE